MKVLLCGSYDAFLLGMIAKIKKENNEIYIISGNNQATSKKPTEVFQEYHFPLVAPSVKFIMSNSSPDAVIFLGAFDSGYEWDEQGQDSVNFIAGLLNVLLTAKAAGVKKFIYLSSYSVFEDNAEKIISETTQAKPRSLHSMTLLQGENTCLLHHEKHNFEVSVIRIGEVYGNYKNFLVKNNIVYQILTGENTSIDPYKEHNMVYIDDLFDGIYKVLSSKKHQLFYHIGSEESIRGGELIARISGYMDSDQKKSMQEVAASVTEYVDEVKRDILINAIKDLGYQPKYTIETGIKRMETAIANRKEVENKEITKKDSINFLGRGKSSLLSYVENILLFLILELILYFTWGANLHETIDLYLWYVVLIVSVHGLTQGKLAILLSILGKYSINIMNGNNITSVFEYNSYLWILQIITIGMLAGYGRDKYKRIVEDLSDENYDLKKEFNNIRDINNSNVIVKNIYERRLLNHNNSMGRIYDIIAHMDSLEPQKIVFEAIDVISQIMNTKDVAIYASDSKSDYCRLLSSSSERAKRMGKSIRLRDTGELGLCLKSKRIYRNNELKDKYPLIAGAIYDNDKIEIVIMVWSLEMEDTNLHQVNIFSIICKLMERSMARAYTFMETVHASSYMENTRVMTEQAFEKILELYNYGKERNMLEYTLLQIETSIEKGEELYQLLDKLTREADYIGKGTEKQMYILLTNTNHNDAASVIDRFQESGISVEVLNQ